MSGSGNEVDQLLATVQAALDATGVYVDPTLARQLEPGQLARVEAAVGRSPEPLYVVVHPFRYDDAFGGNPGDLLTRLHDASGDDGLYVAPESPLPGARVDLEARVWGPDTGATTDTYAVQAVGLAAGENDLGAQLVAVTEAVADGTLEQQYDALPSVVASRTGSGTGSGADDGGSATPYVVGGGVLLVLVLAVVLGRRRPKTPVRERSVTGVPRFTLPASVLERAREAGDLQLLRRAHQEVLDLGESIDATEMTATDPPQAWQAALDHYEAARRILGDARAPERERDGAEDGDRADEVDVLDVVGALVLADRGRQALDAAVAGRELEVESTCFLDPLHERGTARGRIDHDGTEVRVPLCKPCRTALKAGRRPDILDVVRQGRAVHYFETDAEPWASTGYGTLGDVDLVQLLHRS